MEGYHVVRRSDRFWAGLSTDLIIEQVLMRSIKTHGGLTRGKGMTEKRRLVWVLSMPVCSSINETMQKFSGVSYETSDKHQDVSAARQARVVNNNVDLIDYLNEIDPFVQNDSLFNIANGVTAQERVNVEKAREIGVKIVESMAGKSTDEFTFRKANQAVTLGSRSTVKIEGEHVKIDPRLLFQRMLTIRERCDDVTSLFQYELCTYPAALFKSPSFPLQPNKAVLADYLWKSIKEEQRHPSGDVQYVIDGGALLHLVPWPRGSTYESVSHLYVRYVTKKYGPADIVFDGYNDDPTTKDATHLRITGYCVGVIVHFASEMMINYKKDEFLNSKANRQRFIHYLSDNLESAGCTVDHDKYDADVLIVLTAVASARHKETVLIGDDTDLLVLLLHHAEMDAHEVFLISEPNKSAQQNKIWCIRQSKQLLGPDVFDHIHFIHAILGCGVTSQLFGLGKGLAVKRIKSDFQLCQQAKVFNQIGQAKEDIIVAGERALVSLYGGAKEEGLDILRYRRFCDKISKCTSLVEPRTLPPTSAAAMYHSLRVYYHVMYWKGKGDSMKPGKWGWHIVDGKCLPMQTDKPAAPAELLDIISCSCKKVCDTKSCTRRQHGLQCSDVCTECRGTS